MSGARTVALDRLRAFVTVLVVLHHSVLAYCRLGHFDKRHYLASTAPVVDVRRWIGFDVIVAFNDVYFMSLMFLISGLFVLPSLARRGAAGYARGRLVRLGLPFAIAVTTIMPVAYYPSYLQTGASLSFAQYWRGYFTGYGWPGGPAWFVWVLLLLDVIVTVIVTVARRRVTGIVQRAAELMLRRPLRMIAGACTIGVMLYLPLLLRFDPERWVTWGPFAVQASRLLLYPGCFLCGLVLGGGGAARHLMARDGVISRIWPLCAGIGLAAFALWLAMQAAALRQPVLRSLAWQCSVGTLFAICCVLICVAMLGGFLRHASAAKHVLSQIAPSAFGIYVFHYPFVTWSQHLLLHADLPAVAKAAVVFAAALGGSWILVALLRQSRTVAAII